MAAQDVRHTLYLVEGQCLYEHRNKNREVSYKFISVASARMAFNQEPLDSGWLPPQLCRWGIQKGGEEWAAVYIPPAVHQIYLQLYNLHPNPPQNAAQIQNTANQTPAEEAAENNHHDQDHNRVPITLDNANPGEQTDNNNGVAGGIVTQNVLRPNEVEVGPGPGTAGMENGLKSYRVPLPGLIFAGFANRYYAWAVGPRQTSQPPGENSLNKRDTHNWPHNNTYSSQPELGRNQSLTQEFNPQLLVYHAPLPNVDKNGAICWGTNQVGPVTAQNIMQRWELFITSPFNGHLAAGKSRNQKYAVNIQRQLIKLGRRMERLKTLEQEGRQDQDDINPSPNREERDRDKKRNRKRRLITYGQHYPNHDLIPFSIDWRGTDVTVEQLFSKILT